MEARNCPRCNKLFTKIRSPVCPACEKVEEETFDKLKNYISDNQGCTMAELSTETGVPVKLITQFIRDGRLEISKGMTGEITCDRCHTPILRGRYCEPCAIATQRDVADLFKKDKVKTADRMFTAKDKKK